MMQDEGWVKLHRKIEKSVAWSHSLKMRSVWITCLLMANHEKGAWMGQEILPGQFITSRAHLAQKAKVSIQALRTEIKLLEHWKQIKRENLSFRMTRISICNWKTYQDTQPAIQPAANQPPTSHQPATNHKQECKNVRMREVVATTTTGRLEIYTEWFERFKGVNDLCCQVPEHAFFALLEKYRGGAEPEKALADFAIHFAGVQRMDRTPLFIFETYLARSGRGILEKKGAAPAYSVYVPHWQRQKDEE